MNPDIESVISPLFKKSYQIMGTRTGREFLLFLITCAKTEAARVNDGWFHLSLRDEKEHAAIGRTAVATCTEKLFYPGVLTTYSERDFKKIYGGIRRWYRLDLNALQQVFNRLS